MAHSPWQDQQPGTVCRMYCVKLKFHYVDFATFTETREVNDTSHIAVNLM